MKYLLIALAVLLAGCMRSITPVGYAAAVQKCAASGGLAHLSATGGGGTLSFFTAFCKDGTTVKFDMDQDK